MLINAEVNYLFTANSCIEFNPSQISICCCRSVVYAETFVALVM